MERAIIVSTVLILASIAAPVLAESFVRAMPGVSLEALADPSPGDEKPDSLLRESFRIAVPLPIGTRSFRAAVRCDAAHTEIGSGDEGVSLWNLGIAAAFVDSFANGWRLGVSAGARSRSDQPFADGETLEPELLATLRIPLFSRDVLSLGITHPDESRDLPLLLPQASYEWNPSASFRLGIGVPFKILWRPAPVFGLSATWIPTLAGRLQCWSRVRGTPITVFAEWLDERDSWRLTGATAPDSKLKYSGQLIVAGIRCPTPRAGTLEAGAGVSFGRSVIADGDFFSGKLRNSPCIRLSWTITGKNFENLQEGSK